MDATSKARQFAGEVDEKFPTAQAVRDLSQENLPTAKEKGIELAAKFKYGGASLSEIHTEAREHAEAKHAGDTRMAKAMQEGTVLTIVTVAIISIIGILIYSQVNQSLSDPQNAELSNASGNVTSGFADGMNLLPVVFVVMVAALVIAVVQRFRQ